MRLFKLLFPAIFVFIACNSNKTSEKSTSNTLSDTTIITDKIEPESPADESQKQKLEAMTPLSTSELEKLPPTELVGATRTELSANANLGTGMASATYQLSDQSDFQLTILDCGGPAGAGIYGVQYLNLLNADINEENEYSKTIEINGSKAIEQCDKTSNDCSITWFTGGRFLVNLQGKAGADVLKKLATSLKLQD